MSIDYLPFEVLSEIFSYLGVSDLLSATRVCKLWREASSSFIAKRVTIMITDEATPALETFLFSSIMYQNWVFKDVDLGFEGSYDDLWIKLSYYMKSLELVTVDCRERSFMHLLKSCFHLEELRLNDLAHLLMQGTLLNNPEDILLLSNSLKNVTRLHLACSRYLTDTLFDRLMTVVGSLTKLSLAGCQIAYHNAIYKRFYPADGRVQTSNHVLTFDFILSHIEKKAKTLKEISLGRTNVDSDSLCKLSKVPDLQLESVHLMSCEQLSKDGIQWLCENQRNITDLDLSLCSRLTDYAVLSVSDNLPNIRKLNLRRCRGITEIGIRGLRKLRCLEELNISHLEGISSRSIEEALGEEPRHSLKWLSLASLDLEWAVVSNIVSMAPNLLHLDVSMCIAGINDKSVQAICRSLTKLQVLFLNGCTAVSDIGLAGHGLGQADTNAAAQRLSLENLGIANKGLRELNLCGCKKVTDITLTYAVKFQELQYLNLSYCQGVAQEGLEAMAQHCPSLEVLMLAECAQISDHVIMVIAHYLKRIKTLDVQRCVKLTDDSLDSLGSCFTLRYLDVSGCDKMSLEQVRSVQEKIPFLRNFHYRGVKEKEPPVDDTQDWRGFSPSKIPPPPPILSKLKKKEQV